ncbi:membrane progestin receptor beta-like isoform X2 [Girardinichthys multiradiatus]|uniref:membrane progestin receptor beta-like isoform X2 n=1 Tax=Girardinichthys multiradiatus TaxID=208333 RepID=UPI001FACC85C|nr:membrane progestin receptor beta-like isoform X2 [Girardinichthys multiradiatus]
MCSPILLLSLPPTVRDLEVPPLFRRRFILGGYRSVGQPWQHYMLSLFQMHNETLNVWSPLLAAVVVALRFMMFTLLGGGGVLGFRLQGPEGQGLSIDVSSMPLVLYMFSALTYLSSSAAAHLLQPHSEHAHYSLFFLNNVGGAIYLYCCALALYLYCADPAWTQSMLGKIFLPAAAFLSWTSCSVSCYVKVHSRWMYTFHRKLYSLTVITVISPIAHLLAICSWTSTQVVLSLLSAYFFSCSSPECFSPGSFDVLGHSCQLFHVLLSLCMVVQQEALFRDFLWSRPALPRLFGEEHLLLACASILWVTFSCSLTALALRRRVQTRLTTEEA